MVGIKVALRPGDGLVLLLANAFFIVSESAVTRVPQLGEPVFESSHGLELAWEMTERLEVYLSDCQAGITTTGVGLGIVAEPIVATTFDAILGGDGAADPRMSFLAGLALIVINLSHVILGEQVPTYLGIGRSRMVVKCTVSIFHGWMKLMYPVIVVADWLVKRLLSLVGVEIARS